MRITPVRTGHAAAMVLVALMATQARAQSAPDTTGTDSATRRRIQPLPALGSAPETGLQYGATVLAVWQPGAVHRTRPSSITATATRTAKQQSRVRFDGEHWTRGNHQRVAGTLQWQEFPLPYYGIGGDTPASAEETFTPKGIEALLIVQQRLRGPWYGIASVRHVNQDIATDSGGALRGSAIVGTTGGRLMEWSIGALRDTRDHLFAPLHGTLLQATVGRSLRGPLSDFSYGALRVDLRTYRAIVGEHVFATQLQLTSVNGAVPFDQLALAGNSDILRGYARGRYRDNTMGAVQAEYRSPFRRRVGAVAFVGAGAVARTVGGLADASLLPTYGAGLRFLLDTRQRTGVRVDYGRGRDGASGLYLGFNNAF